MVADVFPLLLGYLDTYDYNSIDQNTIIYQQPADLAKQKDTIFKIQFLNGLF